MISYDQWNLVGKSFHSFASFPLFPLIHSSHNSQAKIETTQQFTTATSRSRISPSDSTGSTVTTLLPRTRRSGPRAKQNGRPGSPPKSSSGTRKRVRNRCGCTLLRMEVLRINRIIMVRLQRHTMVGIGACFPGSFPRRDGSLSRARNGRYGLSQLGGVPEVVLTIGQVPCSCLPVPPF